MNSNVIENIEPFNDIYFKSCFYNSLFPVVDYFGSDLNRILFNDIIVYDAEPKGDEDGIGVKYIPILSDDELIDHLKLDVEMKESCPDVIGRIQTDISQNRPVILWVDSFYEPLRTDTYMKHHNPHTLLIYGFDRKQEIFHIIEHKSRENLSYKKRQIAYGDVSQAVKGYQEKFMTPGRFSYYSFIGLRKQTGKHQIQLSEDFSARKENILEGLRYLEKFLDYYRKTVLDEKLLKNNVNDLIKSLNTVINFKRVECYRFKRLFSDKYYLTEMACEIEELWEVLRVDVAKYLFFYTYDRDVFYRGVERSQKILQLEYRFYEELVK
ncbi:MAG TPA: BtrH N-terminal domain-containing protein [Ruminiclostridium sp.]|nr:BtrH N-terminal domain-containing protein [Ruminiclostridium sp.]